MSYNNNLKRLLYTFGKHWKRKVGEMKASELHKISELDINESYFAEYGTDDLFKAITEQNNLLRENNEKLLGLLTDQEIRVGRNNRNWTILTITITIVLGIPAFVPLFRKDYTQELLLEIQEQRKLNTLKEQKDEQFHEKSIFLLDQLIHNQKSSKENLETDKSK